MYIKAAGGVILKNPYSIEELRKENPQTSFPAKPSDKLLEEWSVYRIHLVDPPEVDSTKKVELLDPIYTGGRWQQNWRVVNKSWEEISEKLQEDAGVARAERNRFLEESDWTQLQDAPLDPVQRAEWAQYRQALRDLPQQQGFPYSIVWPVKPA
jgi:hypothetical protein